MHGPYPVPIYSLLLLLLPVIPSSKLDNHLCDTLSSQRLTADKALSLQSRNKVAYTCRQKENCCSEERRGSVRDQCKPLDQAHNTVHAGAHVVGREASDEHVKLLRRWADAKEKGDFNEDKDQAGYSANAVNRGP